MHSSNRSVARTSGVEQSGHLQEGGEYRAGRGNEIRRQREKEQQLSRERAQGLATSC